MRDGVALVSEGGSSVTEIHMPISAGDCSIILGSDMPSVTTAVEGFTLTSVPLNESAAWLHELGKVTFRDCVFRDLVGYITNAGLNVNNGDVDVIGCRFVNCQTQAGGAGIYYDDGRIEIRDSHFEDCAERAIYVASDDTGSEAIVENCTFLNNRGSTGGAVSVGDYLGGLTIRGCFFEGNVDDYTGGGAIALGSSGGPRLIEINVFLFNRTTGAGGRGGAIAAIGSPCWVRGNTFYGNDQFVSSTGGAAVSFGVGTGGSILAANIIAHCTGSPAVYRSTTGPISSTCNVFWQNDHGNAGGSYVLGPTDRTVDPMFCDPVTLDFTLMEGSPCLPESSQGCGQIGVYGQACGAVSVDSHSWGEIKSAYRDGGQP